MYFSALSTGSTTPTTTLTFGNLLWMASSPSWQAITPTTVMSCSGMPCWTTYSRQSTMLPPVAIIGSQISTFLFYRAGSLEQKNTGSFRAELSFLWISTWPMGREGINSRSWPMKLLPALRMVMAHIWCWGVPDWCLVKSPQGVLLTTYSRSRDRACSSNYLMTRSEQALNQSQEVSLSLRTLMSLSIRGESRTCSYSMLWSRECRVSWGRGQQSQFFSSGDRLARLREYRGRTIYSPTYTPPHRPTTFNKCFGFNHR